MAESTRSEGSRSPFSRRWLLTATGGAAAAHLAVQLGSASTAAATADAETAFRPPKGTWQSTRVHYDENGHLVYGQDTERNRIPDFSHAGYRNADHPIPHVPTVATIGPVDGDNTAHIQAAIDRIGQRAPNAAGFRGALLLRAGTYPVHGTIRLNKSGVVLRGVGDDADPANNTVIRAIGDVPHQRDLLVVGGGASTGWSGEVPGTRTPIASELVQVGARSFEVGNADSLRKGDDLIITHPCTEAWLAAVDGGATDVDEPWTVGSQPIVYQRRISAITGNRVTVDVPVFNHLDRALAESYVYKWDRARVVARLGVENLRIDIEFLGDPDVDEDHAWNAIKVRQAEDIWIRGCTMLHFAKAAVETDEVTRATIENCRALDPVSVVTGGLRYNFNTEKEWGGPVRPKAAGGRISTVLPADPVHELPRHQGPPRVRLQRHEQRVRRRVPAVHVGGQPRLQRRPPPLEPGAALGQPPRDHTGDVDHARHLQPRQLRNGTRLGHRARRRLEL